ncbi:hypothetical protein SUNI508_13192 [Seiridium unicorne]|uniref:Uncharacterized protein n=1 Tax=Seiridium unicorne TaxID=138068 RepID=A0ABR2VED5_9PEZI
MESVPIIEETKRDVDEWPSSAPKTRDQVWIDPGVLVPEPNPDLEWSEGTQTALQQACSPDKPDQSAGW